MREVVVYVVIARRDRRGPRPLRHRVGRSDGSQPRGGDRAIGRGDPRPPKLRGMGGLLAHSVIEPFASFINSVTKHVATSSPLAPAWRESSAISGDLVTFVKQLKQKPGGEIGVHASLTVTHTLLAAGLVDELKLVIARKLAGSGRRLLDGLPPSKLSLNRGRTSPSGHLLLDYRVLTRP